MDRSPDRVKVLLALLAVYLIWGSTYLALRFGVESFPPFLLNGIRFLVAGGGMFAVLRWRGHALPSSRQWFSAARVAALLLVGGTGLIALAEDVGVGSGVVATAVATVPVWAAISSGLFGSWPRRLEWAGIAVGLAGVLVLAQEGDFQSSTLGMILIILAPMLWAFGSVWSTRLDLPRALMSTAAELLSGGVLLTVLGLLRGERIEAPPTTASLLALVYLITFGSIVAFTAYVYLLENTRPAMASSYAYVNPAVAVLLAMTLGAETVTGPIFIALPLILVGVAIVALAQRSARRDSDHAPELVAAQVPAPAPEAGLEAEKTARPVAEPGPAHEPASGPSAGLAEESA
jgi:drug/metabolite transporter (DMT)-like permease